MHQDFQKNFLYTNYKREKELKINQKKKNVKFKKPVVSDHKCENNQEKMKDDNQLKN